MLKKELAVFVTCFMLVSSLYSQNILKNEKGYYVAGELYIKMADSFINSPEGVSSADAALSPKLGSMGVTSVKNAFDISAKNLKQAGPLADIKVIKFSGPENPEVMAARLSRTEQIEWAEPRYLHSAEFFPDDPGYIMQGYLEVIKAQQAWDISKGDTGIVIGIVDTGVDWDHPDLEANMWYNEAEMNGSWLVDDDNNGKLDDRRGWDFGGLDGTPDADPAEDKAQHGTHVAGCASAVTNNGIGVASIGYNCKIMPVKAARADVTDDLGNALIYYGNEGIIYAAENGADIINCSWGNYYDSKTGREVVRYAEKLGALVVSSAGNDNTNLLPAYPAAYREVLAVTATDSETDKKAEFSNYGFWVDVSAPGTSITSTWQYEKYATGSGTSMSAPVVSGLAALVKSVFPGYSPRQIIEQIRQTTDNIDTKNTAHSYMLGTGRINAEKALSSKDIVSVRMENFSISQEERNDDAFGAGERISLSMDFTNYLAPVSGLEVNLSSTSKYVKVINGKFSPAALATGETFSTRENDFIIQVDTISFADMQVLLRLDYSSSGGSSYEVIPVVINPSYLTQKENNISLTTTSSGSFGYNDFPFNQRGEGLRFKNGENLLVEGSLMYTCGYNNVSDNARNWKGYEKEKDFYTVDQFRLTNPGNISLTEGYLKLKDTQNNIETELNTFSYGDGNLENSVILLYKFFNKGKKSIEDFHAGLFMDFDLNDFSDDIAEYNLTDNFGYVKDTDNRVNDITAAVALISSPDYNYYTLNSSRQFGVRANDGFSDSEKYTTLTSGLVAGNTSPGDAALVVSGGPYDIPAGKSIEVAFVMTVDSSLSGLTEQVNAAREKYVEEIEGYDHRVFLQPETFVLGQNYPNPFNPSTTISYKIGMDSRVKLNIYNILGQKVKTLVNEFQEAGNYKVDFFADGFASGVYFYSLQTDNYSAAKKMIILR